MVGSFFEELTEVGRRGFLGKVAAVAAAFVTSLAFPRLTRAGVVCGPNTYATHGCCLCKNPGQCT